MRGQGTHGTYDRYMQASWGGGEVTQSWGMSRKAKQTYYVVYASRQLTDPLDLRWYEGRPLHKHTVRMHAMN